ncbi:unnamed protein product [Spodoptera littoralis]|uniref:Uncharacterized protein n=1 Tax=Spodoptera littoralis TaxID=7109 RepID=A0A9P0I5T0_SPOLI|nr:unnamed protein product [Spodoptera littoralis]CAH1640699.1 unnamed protein product [Spodoptera littoralis]
MKGLLLLVLLAAAASASILNYEVTEEDNQEEDTLSPDLDDTPDHYEEEVMLRISPTPTATDIDEWAELFRMAVEEGMIHRNLSMGNIGAHDILLSKTHHIKNDGDTNVSEDVYFRCCPTTVIITAIRGGSVSENMKSLFLIVLLVVAASTAVINQETAADPDLVETFEEFDLGDDPDISYEPDVADVTEVPISDVTSPSIDVATCCSVGARSGKLLVRASIIAGGLNRNFVTIRLQSARGRGYKFRIQIYGR